MALRHAAARFAALGAVSSTTATRAFGTSAMRATEAQKESIASFMSAFEAVKPSTMDNPSTPSDFMKPLPEVPATPPAKLTLNFYVPHNVEFDGAEVEQVQVPATSGDMGVLPGHVPTVVQMRPGVVAVTLNDKDVQKVRARVMTEHTLDCRGDEIERRARHARDRAAGNPTAKSSRAASRSFPCRANARNRHVPVFVFPPPPRASFASPLTSVPLAPPTYVARLEQYFVSSGFAFVHADSTTDICAVEAVPVEQLDAEAVKKGLADYQAKLVNAKDDYEKASAQIGIEVCGAMNSALGN
jgi:F0F1-type ATP synthase epsilon subunit